MFIPPQLRKNWPPTFAAVEAYNMGTTMYKNFSYDDSAVSIMCTYCPHSCITVTCLHYSTMPLMPQSNAPKMEASKIVPSQRTTTLPLLTLSSLNRRVHPVDKMVPFQNRLLATAWRASHVKIP